MFPSGHLVEKDNVANNETLLKGPDSSRVDYVIKIVHVVFPIDTLTEQKS